MVKNIIFDVGNVLVEFRPIGLMEDLGFPKDVIDELYNKVVMNAMWNELDRGIQTEKEVIEDFKKLVPGLESYLDQFFFDTTNLCFSYDYSADWLKSFQEKGYKTYILSNYPKDIWALHEKTQFTFMPYVNGKIVSGYVKMIKPDEEIYKCLLETYNLKPEECVFMDDRPANIETARKLGFNGIVFTSKEEAEKELEKLLTQI